MEEVPRSAQGTGVHGASSPTGRSAEDTAVHGGWSTTGGARRAAADEGRSSTTVIESWIEESARSQPSTTDKLLSSSTSR